MTEAVDVCLSCGSFLEFLKTLAWCRQGDDALVAVHKCTPEVVEALRVHEVKVFPGGIAVRMNKSWLTYLDERDREGEPVPVLVVWKSSGIELWYRRHKSYEFPYDMWQDPAAAAYERERAWIPAEHLGPSFLDSLKEVAGKVKPCPSVIPLL
ncbi:MAG: MmcQ/YjbR family DNA-binding protein [Candidatus Melainabacteria bacterium]|nr:MmcQ/YjbR family DNA-binding protein [Candidatus Melainabacteria bacterium]